jgi:hypothetical protein
MLRLFALLMGLTTTAVAAESAYDAYRDETLGWKKVYHFGPAQKALKVDDKVYSPAQISIAGQLANWMQASYLPKGGLGDVRKTALERIGLYNTYNSALPPSYGARADTFVFLKQVDGKWVNETTHSIVWEIVANKVPENYIDGLTNEKQYYFTIPGMDPDHLRQAGSREFEYRQVYDLSGHPVIGQYLNWVVPDFGQSVRQNVVILSGDKRMPFIQVSLGEVLDKAEAAVPVYWEKEKKKILERTQGMPRDTAFYTQSELEKIDRAKDTLTKLRAKYRGLLGDGAYLQNGNFVLSDLANGYDVFTGQKLEIDAPMGKIHPVYKVDPELQARCKTDQPQWLSIRWLMGGMEEPAFRHMHDAIVNNFNFDYVYDYFFAPEKVRGKTYAPRRDPAVEEKPVAQAPSVKAAKARQEAGVHLFEDFSTTPAGKLPANWSSTPNGQGRMVQVETQGDEDRPWAVIKGQSLTAKGLKPLPENFRLTYNVAVPKGFTWGGKRLITHIGKGDRLVAIELRPGADGAGGWLTVSNGGPPSALLNDAVAPFNREQAVPGFSNNLPFNGVTVAVEKSGASLGVSVNQQPVVVIPEAFKTPSIRLDGLQFKHSRSDSDTEKYYLGDIRIEAR